MGIEILSTTQLLQGVFSSIYVSIQIIVGLTIASKYVKYKKIEFLLIGIAWIGISIPWLPDVINFILIIANQNPLTPELYLTIVNAFLPIFILLWLYGFSNLLKIDVKKKQRYIFLTIILSGIFELLFFSLLNINRRKFIGDEITPFQYQFSDFIGVYFIICMVFILITGSLFARESIKSGNKEIALKGKLLLIGFILFITGAVIDSLFEEITSETVIIARSLLISSSIIFYMGFILPDWAKKIFLKQ